MLELGILEVFVCRCAWLWWFCHGRIPHGRVEIPQGRIDCKFFPASPHGCVKIPHDQVDSCSYSFDTRLSFLHSFFLQEWHHGPRSWLKSVLAGLGNHPYHRNWSLWCRSINKGLSTFKSLSLGRTALLIERPLMRMTNLTRFMSLLPSEVGTTFYLFGTPPTVISPWNSSLHSTLTWKTSSAFELLANTKVWV